MKKIYAAMILMFYCANFALCLDSTYVMPYLKQTDKITTTGLMTGFKLNDNLLFETGFETPLLRLKECKTNGIGFKPVANDFYFGITKKIDKVLIGWKHSCYHYFSETFDLTKDGSIVINDPSDDILGSNKKYKSRNKFYVEF